jgi:DNA mismatch repair protein MutS2
MNVKPEQVELQARASPAPPAQTTVVLPDAESPGLEVHLRGMRAEEAIETLEKFLDRAYLAGLPYVRVVHGKGTGTLRKIAREHLASSSLVASYETAPAAEGGEGVTIAHLAGR